MSRTASEILASINAVKPPAKIAGGEDTKKFTTSGFTRSELIEALMLEAKHLSELGQDFRRKYLENLETNELEIEAQEYAQGAALARLKKIKSLPAWDELVKL